MTDTWIWAHVVIHDLDNHAELTSLGDAPCIAPYGLEQEP